MNDNVLYSGDLYSFYRDDKRLGHGGNGSVYDVRFSEAASPQLDYHVVAKFFKYEGSDVKERYQRFCREIKITDELKNIKGIMPIIDKKMPLSSDLSKDSAWYLMPKEECFKVNRRHNLIDKINDMIELAEIIERVHGMGYAHRDIKPENILIYHGRLVLSDLGMVWQNDEERLTRYGERIGPYKIMPPEFEHTYLDRAINFTLSDVYLFAKVLWMTLKEDNIGFRGQYNRNDIQIYLNKDALRTKTLEPIHELLEKATDEDINKRISIVECIKLLKEQKNIIAESNAMPLRCIQGLQYEEECRKMISASMADELSFLDMHKIIDVLKSIIPYSDVHIKTIQDERVIRITNLSVSSNWVLKLEYFNNGEEIKEYLINVKKMIYERKTGHIVLELGDIDNNDKEYVSYAETQRGFGDIYRKIQLGSAERMIFSKPQEIDLILA